MQYTLIQVRSEDFELIRQWRNEQLDILRTEGILTKEAREKYREWYFDQCASYKPKDILYTILMENEPVGYGGLVHIDWEKMEAETSFLLKAPQNPTYTDHVYRIFLSCLRDYTEKLGLKAWTSETFSERKGWAEMLERHGWKRIGYSCETKMGRRQMTILHRREL